MVTRQFLQHRRHEILDLAARHGADRVRIFGSVARGDAQEASDVDLLVRFAAGQTLFDQGELLLDLQDLLGIKVDLISEGALSGRFAEMVLKEAVAL